MLQLCLIGEAGVVPADLMRRSSDRTFQQIGDPVLQDVIGGQPDRVADTLGFEEFVHLGIGEGRIAPEIETLHDAPVAGDHRLQHRAPVGGAVHVARPQGAALNIPELVEHISVPKCIVQKAAVNDIINCDMFSDTDRTSTMILSCAAIKSVSPTVLSMPCMITRSLRK